MTCVRILNTQAELRLCCEVPALAILATPRSGRDIPGYRVQYDAESQKAHSDRDPYVKRQMEQFRAGVTHGKVVDFPGGNHYVFLSNPADVVRELRAFARESVEPFQR